MDIIQPKIKPSLNVLDEEGRQKHMSYFFTPAGYSALNLYLQGLALEFFKRKDSEYPFKIGIILGIPHFNYAVEFKNRSELEGRIKGYAQLLGLKNVKAMIGETEIIIELDGTQQMDGGFI